jgi:hypothetical protein
VGGGLQLVVQDRIRRALLYPEEPVAVEGSLRFVTGGSGGSGGGGGGGGSMYVL